MTSSLAVEKAYSNSRGHYTGLEKLLID